MTKQIFIALAFVATTLTTTVANNVEYFYSLEGTTVKIAAVSASKSIIVDLANIQSEGVKIVLEDETGRVFVNETVNAQKQFTQKYNLKNLEAGDYRLVITKNGVKTIQPFKLTDKSVVMFEGERKDKFLPTVHFNSAKLDVNVLLGNYSNIQVNIYDNEGRKVFEDINYVVLTLHKRYDVEKLAPGFYVVEVIAGDETQYFTVIR